MADEHIVVALSAPGSGSVTETNLTLPFGNKSVNTMDAAGPTPTQQVLISTVFHEIRREIPCLESNGVAAFVVHPFVLVDRLWIV